VRQPDRRANETSRHKGIRFVESFAHGSKAVAWKGSLDDPNDLRKDSGPFFSFSGFHVKSASGEATSLPESSRNRFPDRLKASPDLRHLATPF